MDRSILRFDKPNIKVLLLAAGGTLCLPVGTCTDLFNRTIPGVSQKDIHRNWNKRLKRGLHLSFYQQRNTYAFYNRSHFRGIILRGLLTEYGIRKSIIIAAIIYSVAWGVHDLITCIRINIRTMVRLVVCI